MIELNADGYSLRFDENLAEIASLTFEGKRYVDARLPIFTIGLRNEAGDIEKISADAFILTSAKSDRNGFTCAYESLAFSVVLSASKADGGLEWRISTSAVKGKVVEWINYPQFAVPDDFANNGGSSKLLWGFNEGVLIENMDERDEGLPYLEPDYPGRGLSGIFPAVVETQFMAYYDERSGLYFASHDRENNYKGISFARDCDRGVRLEFRHYTGSDFDTAYSLPYPMVTRFFHGDWTDAAQIYKDWFNLDRSDEFIPIEKNAALPAWYGESPIVITYPVRGIHDMDEMKPNKLFPYINVMPIVEKFEKATDGKIMVILMHWEGTAPWAPPIVWPPYGGEAELKKLIDALHERGDVLGVYCSGLGWTINSNVAEYNTQKEFDEKELWREMCLSPKQDLPYSNICTGQRSGYDMCPTREFTVKTIRGEVEKMANAGIDYVQLMDQNHGGTSYVCYSKSHGHPPVPGKWQVDAVKNLLKTAEEGMDGVLFGCESAAAESYIPHLLLSDNRFNLNYNIGKPVPAYSFVYHEYLNNFMGNQVCATYMIDHKRSPEAFFERIAYSFCAGDLTTFVLNQDGEIQWSWGQRDFSTRPDEEKSLRLTRNLNYWRKAYKKYLHSGSMVKPLPASCDTRSIYRARGSQIVLPAVHTSAFKASDGNVGQFFANYTDENQTVAVSLGDAAYSLINADGSAKSVSGELTFVVPPLSAILLEKSN